MSDDNQTEVELLREELQKSRQGWIHAEEHFQVLATLCAGYHALLFGDHQIPPKDHDLVMRAIAYSSVFAMLKHGAKNLTTEDITVDNIPGHPEPVCVNVTVQRVDGKSPRQLLEEHKAAIESMVSALTPFAPGLAETLALSRPEEVPAAVEKWQKSAAIACPVDSTAYTQSHT